MSVDTELDFLEGHLASYDDEEALTPYHIDIKHSNEYDWFYVIIHYGDHVIAKKSCVKSHRRAGRWARKQIRQHLEARAIIGDM